MTKQLRDTGDLIEIDEMIEEFRISLFAQQLGTKYPISLKRIKNKLQNFQINS
jgi:ATP-dependent helicase HrpA